MNDGPSTASLVLGSGGARGLAHIGVIRRLEERGHVIGYVAGSSMGALVGGIHAASRLDDYADWARALHRSDIVRLLDWSFERGSLFKGERVIGVLRELVGDVRIEDLPIGYTAVATDVSRAGAGREVWLNRGPLFDAIRASIAVPGVLAPVATGGRLLVDGGVVNPVPVAPTLNAQSDLTVAVDLNGAPEPPPSRVAPRTLERAAGGTDGDARRRSIAGYLDRFWPSPPTPPTPAVDSVGFSDVLLRSLEAAQATITGFRFAANRPSLVIRIPRNVCGFFDFHRAEELIECGYRCADRALADHDRRRTDRPDPPSDADGATGGATGRTP